MKAGPKYRMWRGRSYAEWPDGDVYFVVFADGREVAKIGWSQNTGDRLFRLRYEYRAQVVLFDRITIPRGSPHWGVGYGGLEQRIHRELWHKRIDPWTLAPVERGEWYAFTRPELAQLVANVRANIAREDAAA